jgi:hypothetical protein
MSHVNIIDIDFEKVKIGKSGKTIKLLYDNSPLQLVTSKMYAPFGVKINQSDYSHFTNCHLDCSVSQSTLPTGIEISENFESLDKKIIEVIKSNSNLFNQKDVGEINFNEDAFYTPIFKGNSTYPKLMKISLPRDKNGNFDFVIFDESKKKIKIDDSNIEEVLTKGKNFKCIIECSKIWTYKNRIGTTWNVIQMRFCENLQNYNRDDPDQTVKSKVDYSTNLMIDDD